MRYKNKYKTYQYHTGSLRWSKVGGTIRNVILTVVGFLFNKNINKIASLLYKTIPNSPCKEFHINDRYIIIDGEFKGQKFGDAIKKCTTLCMLYVEDNPDGTLKHIDFEIIK